MAERIAEALNRDEKILRALGVLRGLVYAQLLVGVLEGSLDDRDERVLRKAISDADEFLR